MQEPPSASADVVHVDDDDDSALGEQEEQSKIGRLFPNAIQTADMKHIMDNILKECLSVMSSRPGSKTGKFFFWFIMICFDLRLRLWTRKPT